MEALRDILRISMPERALAAIASYNTGLMLGGGWNPFPAALGSATIVLAYCAGAVYNCIRDREADLINQADPPLGDGRLGIRFAYALMLAYAALSLFAAYLTHPVLAVADIAAIILGIVYSRYTKSILFLSYLTLVTTHLAVPLISGYVVAGAFHPVILFIAGFMLVSEIFSISIKDFKDVEGDRKMGVQTLPVVFSPEVASRITFIGMTFPLILVWFPWYFFKLSLLFLAMTILASSLKMMLGYRLMKNPKRDTAKKVLGYFRYIMIIQIVSWCFI